MSTLMTFDEHGDVLSYWCHRGFRGETMVCFDRHIDLKKIAAPHVARILEAGADPARLATLNRDLPFRDDDRFAYGLDSFLFAAAALGQLSRLVLVLPEDAPLDAIALGHALAEHLSLIPGHGEEALEHFEIGPHSAQSRILGMTIEVTTLRHLTALALPRSARVDVDLDFFVDPNGRVSHGVEEMAAALEACGISGAVESATRSITSGFLPRSHASIEAELARRLGRELAPRDRPTRRVFQSLELLATHGAVDPASLERLWRHELCALAGPGWAMRAALALRIPDLVEAERCYENARAGEQRASWVAYAFALGHLARREYRLAERWFARASSCEVVDTVEARSAILRALAAQRDGRPEEALGLALECVRRLPMRLDGYRIAAAAADRLGRVDEARELRARGARVKQVTGGAG